MSEAEKTSEPDQTHASPTSKTEATEAQGTTLAESSDETGARPSSGGRKSLEGLSPQQDAKVGTLKQMF